MGPALAGSHLTRWLFVRRILPSVFLAVMLGTAVQLNTQTLQKMQETFPPHTPGVESRRMLTQVREVMPLQVLTNSSAPITCPEGLIPIHDTLGDPQLTFQNRQIPRIVHLTGKSRCLHPILADNVAHWGLPDHSLFFHDDAAMDQLLYRDWPEFPQLKYVLKCILFGGAVKADIWRLLVLWEYGGIYADFDSRPAKFNATTLAADDEAFLVMDRVGTPSQWFMSARPRHPLIYCIIYALLENVIKLDDVGDLPIVWVTGPGAVSAGFSKFLGPHVKRTQPDTPGLYTGAYGTTVRIAGTNKNENEYIERNIYETSLKKDGVDHNKAKHGMYESMGMAHLTTFGNRAAINRKNETCVWRMWHEEMKDALLWSPSW